MSICTTVFWVDLSRLYLPPYVVFGLIYPPPRGLIPNYRNAKFPTFEELHEWYPEPESTRDPHKIQMVQEERKKRIVKGAVESRRSHRKDSFQKLKPLGTGDVVEKGKRKPKRRAEFSIGDKVKASLKNSRGKYPGTVVSVGKGVYGIQFDEKEGERILFYGANVTCLNCLNTTGTSTQRIAEPVTAN